MVVHNVAENEEMESQASIRPKRPLSPSSSPSSSSSHIVLSENKFQVLDSVPNLMNDRAHDPVIDKRPKIIKTQDKTGKGQAKPKKPNISRDQPSVPKHPTGRKGKKKTT